MASIARTIRRWTALACIVPLAAGTLVACGGDSNDDSSPSSGGASGGGAASGGGVTLAETAQESGGLSFSKSSLSAQAGKVTLKLSNPSGNQLPHAIEVEGNGVEEETETIQPGGEASVSVDLEPGTYEFYCPVGNHRAQGMEGTLTVS